MMNPVPWLQMTNMISYQGLVRTFPSGMREVDGSPFYLSENEISSSFGVNASLNSNGVIMYQCEGGPSIDSIQVNDGEIYEI
ncbi:hypothetical protein [Klebsiella sp. WP3-S18-ESBL-05]|uniref:hypothetical protein n=1 Tax=Klebsiella sp. WP3-S18-ESBL-05 TaxID=2675711 RepID=UPI0016001BF7|nr:hypothetical protein [Klebsiella sp. WP3-S18-ESBL-05]